MDQAILERMIRVGKLSTADVLLQTPVERLEEAIAMLKQHRPARDICQGLTERIAVAPRGDFDALKRLYFRHCVERPARR